MSVRDDVLARRWLVGVELINHRAPTRITQAVVAKTLGVSQSMVSQHEKGLHLPEPDQVAEMLRMCGAPADAAKRLADLAAWPADGRSWLAPWEKIIAKHIRTFIGAEGFASELFRYCPLVVPTLLQTERYAAAMTTRSAQVSQAQGRKLVELRMARQERVHAGDLHFTAVIEEHVLDRMAGSREVMAEELRHLKQMAEKPNVDVLIIPTSVGFHEGLDGRFALLEFNDDTGQRIAGPVGYVEWRNDAEYITDQDQVASYTEVKRELLRVALPQDKSLAAIDERLAA